MDSTRVYRRLYKRVVFYLLEASVVSTGADAIILIHWARKVGGAMGFSPVEALELFVDIIFDRRPAQIDYFGLSMANIRARFEDMPTELDYNTKFRAAIVAEIHAAYERLSGKGA